MWLKSAAKFAAGLLLAVGLLWWLLRKTDLDAVADQLRQASVPGLCLATVLLLAHVLFRVWRWGVLLRPVRRHVAFRPMFDAIILGYMTTWTIPGRLGELVRPALLAGRSGLPLGACLGTVLADRLLDGFGVVILFGVGLALTPLAGEAAEHAALIRGGAALLLLAIALPLCVLIAAAAWRGRVEAWLVERGRLVSWLGHFTLSVSRGVDALKQPKLLALGMGHTLAAWLLIAAGTWVGVRACGADISFGAMLVILPVLVLGIALPTPGGAGGYHAALTFGLNQLFAVSRPVAVGASIAMHVIVVVPMILLGLVLLFVDRIPFQDLLRAGRQVRELGAAAEIPVTPPPSTAEKL